VKALYDTIGKDYRNYRRPDPRIAAMILDALGDARSVVNIGAGAGSYEPRDRPVVAVEPSAVMIAQRPPDAAEARQATADALPFADNSFDAAMAILSVHHWPDQRAGLREMKRVAKKRCVILTWDAPQTEFWFTRDYFPEIAKRDKVTFSLAPYREVFGDYEIRPVPIPHDCSDGFLCAYWRRPEAYLDPGVRLAISSFAALGDVSRVLWRLAGDLEDGTWMRRNGHLMAETELDLGYRLIVTR
jgi:SAM-dependent methyltransferase